MKSYKNILFVFSLLTFFSCEKTFFEPEPLDNPEALFEDLWTTFNTDYAPFEERGVDWQEQYQVYRSQVNATTNTDELFDIMKQMLRSLNDGHVAMVVPNEKVYNSNIIFDERIDDDLFDLDLIKSKYLQNIFLESGEGGNTYGWIGSIGYLNLAWIGDNMLVFNDVLDYFASGDGLIIDMRHNQGGDFTYAYSEMGRLTNVERYAHRSKTKNGKGKDDYTKWYNWNFYPSGSYFDKQIVLLTDRFTISAGERTVMALKTLPNLVQMGDTTNGALSTKIGKELANGWYYSVSPQKIEFNDGISYEGAGLPPDIFVKNTSTEMEAGKDKTLEEALAQF